MVETDALADQGVTAENLGDLLVYRYAGYLREFDAQQAALAEFETAAEQKEAEGSVALSRNMRFDDLKTLSIDAINALTIDEAAKDALARAHMLLGAHAIKQFYLRNRQTREYLDAGELWPKGHQVQVEAVEGQASIFPGQRLSAYLAAYDSLPSPGEN